MDRCSIFRFNKYGNERSRYNLSNRRTREWLRLHILSGKPAIGVGAGNVPAIIDDSADILLAVNSIIHSKTFDNGMICASEQSVIILNSIYDKVKQEFIDRGCYVFK